LHFEEDIQQCATILHAGGIILYPTDTIWGLGCDATNETAVKKIYEIKQRAESKSLIVLVATENDIIQHVAAPDLALFDYLNEQQRPVTVIYEHALGLADNVVAADGSVGIRIANDLFCRALIKRFGKPIVSTSANISGEMAPAGFLQISEYIKKKVDYIVNHRQKERIEAKPSMIIRWNNGEPIIIRQ
jgi:L-threonylcarbamoyladenylate synthase